MLESGWAVDAFGAKSTAHDGSIPKCFLGTSSVTGGVLNVRRCTHRDSVQARKQGDIPAEGARFGLEQTI